MSQRPNPPLSRHANSAINEYLLCNEAPWNCLHLRLPWAENAQSQPFLPSTSPTDWSTVSNGSSVLAEDEQSVRVDLLALTSAMSIHDSFPETSGSFGQHHEDFGQVFAGSSATDVTDRLGTSSRDAGHATRSKAAPSAKSFGEICESGETISAAAPQVRYLGCPFSKYDPARYEHVNNVCTHRPGWEELKRVLEHLRKVHSKKNRCENCRTQYPKQIDFEKHMLKKDCTKVEETDPKYPELMTAEQEAIFDKVFDAMPYEDKWRAYYRFLFPNASNHHSIDPYYDYTTLTHLLEPASLTSQKRPASPLSKLEDSPQYKRKSRGVSSTTTQADSVINQSVGLPDYPPPVLADQVHQDPIYQEIGTNEFTDIASLLDASVNQNQEIGTSKCVDGASPPIDIDSAYGSRDGIIPSSSNLHAPIMSPLAPPRLNRGDSGIALSSNASVLTGPKTTQSRSGSAAQDDPNLPSHMISPEEQSHLGFDLEGLLDPNMFGSIDHHEQKSA